VIVRVLFCVHCPSLRSSTHACSYSRATHAYPTRHTLTASSFLTSYHLHAVPSRRHCTIRPHLLLRPI
jgi:hypothetical protein